MTRLKPQFILVAPPPKPSIISISDKWSNGVPLPLLSRSNSDRVDTYFVEVVTKGDEHIIEFRALATAVGWIFYTLLECNLVDHGWSVEHRVSWSCA